MQIRPSSWFLALALACAGCGGETSSPAKRSRPEPSAIEVNWADPGLHLDLPQGWSIERCEGPPVTLCVAKDRVTAGTIRFHDLPSQGQEATTSDEQVQAVLAVRIHTLYKDLKAQREKQCGAGYRLDADTPRVVQVAGKPGMKYAATGFAKDRIHESVVGYRVFRTPIESQIEARAEPNGCGGGGQPGFSVEALESFEPLLDRLVAGSRLPPPTRFIPSPAPTPPDEP